MEKRKNKVFMNFNKNKLFKILAIVFVLLILVWVWVFIDEQDNEFLEIDFFDVGQGDSIFIETPKGKQVLIDGGPDLTILEKLGQEMPFWDRYIDLIVLTHPEHDHINGLIEVMKRYKVGGILTNGVVRDTAEYKEWIKVIQKENIPIFIAQAGEIIDLDDNIKLFVLYPLESLEGQKVKKANNTSIVNQLVYKNFELLLTGDIEKEVEKKLIDANINLQSDILKVPHHGSKTSSTKGFIEAVNPLAAVIQAGKNNSYGHPYQDVLDRLNLNNIAVFRTDQDGDVKVLTDGINFQVK